MYAGAIALMVRAVIAAGGISETWSIAKSRGRIDGLTNIDPNPFQYMTVWTGFFGGIFYWLGGMGANQIALQRYCSLPTLRGAQSIAFMSIPAFSLNFFVVFSTGVAMFAYYANCDPMKDPSLDPPVKSRDRLVIHFVLDVLGDFYGLPGLFLACILSGTLSTISSGINSLAAVTHEELIRPIWPSMQERTSMFIIKIISVLFGAITIGRD